MAQSFQWKNLPVMIMVGFLIISFASWGIMDVFTGTSRNTVAKVGKETVSGVEWSRAFQDVKDRYSAFFGTITPELEQAFNMQGIALQQVVERKIFAQEAKRLGVGASDAEIREAIAKNPTFQKEGVFDKETFENFLSSSRQTEADYSENMFNQVAQARLRSLTTVDGGVPGELILRVMQHRGQQRDALMVTMPAIAPETIATPEAGVLEPYYEERAASYVTPEYRQLAYVHLNPAAYNPENLEGDALKDLAYQLSVDLEDALGGGASLDEVAKQFNASLHRTQLLTAQGTPKAEGPIHTTKNRSLPAFGNFLPTLFALEEAQDSGIVFSEDGTQFYLAIIETIEPSTPMDFAAAKADVLANWQKEEAARLSKETAQKHAQDLATLLAKTPEKSKAETYVKQHELLSELVENVYRSDAGQKQDTPTQVADALFALDAAQIAAGNAVQQQDGAYVIPVFLAKKTVSIDDPRLGLEATRQRISAQMQREQQSQYVEFLKTRYPVRYTFPQNGQENSQQNSQN